MVTSADEGHQHHHDEDPQSRLVDMMVTEIRCQGYFVAHVAPVSEQDVVDLRWTAQLAGRAMDRPVRTRVRWYRDHLESTATVVVAPTQARTPDEAALLNQAQAKIEHLLGE